MHLILQYFGSYGHMDNVILNGKEIDGFNTLSSVSNVKHQGEGDLFMDFKIETHKQQTEYFLSLLVIERNLTQKTVNAYKSDLKGLAAWMLEYEHDSLNQSTILLYFNWLQTQRKLHPKSIHRKYVSIRQFCNFLLQEGYSSEIFFRFSSRKFIIPKSLPKTLTNSTFPA